MQDAGGSLSIEFLHCSLMFSLSSNFICCGIWKATSKAWAVFNISRPAICASMFIVIYICTYVRARRIKTILDVSIRQPMPTPSYFAFEVREFHIKLVRMQFHLSDGREQSLHGLRQSRSKQTVFHHTLTQMHISTNINNS